MAKSAGISSKVSGALRRTANRAVTAVRPHLPPPAYAMLVELVSVVGAGPVQTVPLYDRVLVVAPHPDDETIGCGGTLALLAARGCRIEVLVATDGGATEGSGLSEVELMQQRRAEAMAACVRLGASPPTFLGLPDGGLTAQLPRLTAAIAAAAATSEPQAVFVPWLLDGHPDHQAVCIAAARAGLDPNCHVWGYEVWAALPPNRVVDVTAVWSVKEQALAEHRMAYAGFDASAYLALQRWRSILGRQGHGYQEAFLVLSPQQLNDCVDQLSRESPYPIRSSS